MPSPGHQPEVIPAPSPTGPGSGPREWSPGSLLVGSLMGAVLILGNVYMGLRAGVVVGGSLLAALLSFVVMRGLRRSFSPLENNIAQTVGSASGTLGNVWDVLPALVLLGTPLGFYQALIWCFSVSLLGIFFSIPLRRQLVVIEKLPFPDGTACAETIRSLHDRRGDAARKAGALGLSGAGAALFTFLKDGMPGWVTAAAQEMGAGVQQKVAALLAWTTIPGRLHPFDVFGRIFRGHPSSEVYLGLSTSPMFLAIGILVGPRIGLSMLLGALVSWGVIAPWLLDEGIIEAIKYKQTVGWTMWAGTALMVSAGLTSLLRNTGALADAFESMARARGTMSRDRHGVEVPFTVWAVGLGGASLAVLTAMRLLFEIPVWAGVMAIALSFLLAIMATRAMGETNINPTGAMGHVTQGAFSAISGTGPLSNVLAGGVTAAGAAQSADIMQDLKAGALLGANPRRQFHAQILGVTVGALVGVPTFFLLWKAYGLGPDSERLPAPSGISWSSFAHVLEDGFDALPQHAPQAMLVAAIVGVALSLAPRSLQRWLPSPFGLGIAFIYPGFYALSVCLGALLGAGARRIRPEATERYGYVVASGLIVGESVTGTLIAAWMLSGEHFLPTAAFLGLPLLFLGFVVTAGWLAWRQLRT